MSSQVLRSRELEAFASGANAQLEGDLTIGAESGDETGLRTWSKTVPRLLPGTDFIGFRPARPESHRTPVLAKLRGCDENRR
jgi:hypothetical protein